MNKELSRLETLLLVELKDCRRHPHVSLTRRLQELIRHLNELQRESHKSMELSDTLDAQHDAVMNIIKNLGS